MKKSLIAMAAMVATGAFAQSSLTISGQLDAGIVNQKGSTGLSQTAQGAGQFGASRLRFTGTEDLGGGLKASFNLEMQPNMANGGTNGNGLFNRGAWLQLGSDSVGALRIGRQATVAMDLICGADQHGCYSGFNGGGVLFNGTGAVATTPTGRWISGNVGRGQNGNVGISSLSSGPGLAGGSGDVTRVINAFTYRSANFSGFTGQLQYALGGAPTPNGNSGNGNAMGLSLNYANGPIMVGLAYQTTNADLAATSKGNQTTIGGTYDFSVVKVGALYQSESASSVNGSTPAWTKANGWALTAVAPMGAFAPYIKVGSHKTNGLGSYGIFNGADASMVNIGTTYNLSKRTKVYADFARDGKGNSGRNNLGALAGVGVTGVNNSTPQVLAIGLQHTF